MSITARELATRYRSRTNPHAALMAKTFDMLQAATTKERPESVKAEVYAEYKQWGREMEDGY